MKLATFPFRQPAPESVNFDGWYLSEAEFAERLAPELQYWDFRTVLDLRGTIEFDIGELLFASHLDAKSTLGVLVSATSESANAEVALTNDPVRIQAGTQLPIPIEVTLVGKNLSRTCAISIELVVLDPVPTSPLGAERPGSILWSHQDRFILEGSGAQFPTYAEDFSSSRPSQANALWEIYIDDSDLQANFLSNVHVVLNTAHAEVRDMLRGSGSKATVALQRHLDFDVTRRIIATALATKEVVSSNLDFDDQSVMGGLRRAVAFTWPKADICHLADLRGTSPGLLEAEIQHMRGESD
ncbi:hypothetical protein CIK75_11135 [Glutamicibacter sp. BW78]|uniref:hypothetical protein n=1 Tax=Glutamicibacter sp. BW78 TaxID=2024403 RepID=UPI000BB6CAE0|nr:hypothetical protein [Glutamicibacter sp. BW78]PCC24724.1 hypothetical protein CIK75_11135 [Glutamicibacter sp. BW78]